MKLTISKSLHAQMIELSRRGVAETGERVGALYLKAIVAYLQRNAAPKSIRRQNRRQYRFKAPEALPPLMIELQKIASHREIELPTLVDEVIKEFVSRPENYLGQEFYKRLKKKIEGLER